jgi:Tfp pilus assembly protein PilO
MSRLSSTNRLIVAMVALAALAAAFWMLVLSPKRDEVSKLEKQAKTVRTSLATHREEVARGLEAKRNFPVDYQQLVVLGKAVPGDDDTASLLVQVNRIADRAHVRFSTLKLTPAEGAGEAAEAPTSESAGGTDGASPVSPTEVAAATMPLGAAIGPAGLGVMPYTLTFDGSFFSLADFIKGLDSLVKTNNAKVAVNGRLITVDGFALGAGPQGFPQLEGTFGVTTYLTPPDQGITAGAEPSGPGAATATPAATTIGGTG